MAVLAGFDRVHSAITPYLGVVGLYPYLWISFVTARLLRTGQRKSGLQFARIVLLMAVLMRLVDLASFGWSRGLPGEGSYRQPMAFRVGVAGADRLACSDFDAERSSVGSGSIASRAA